MQRFEQMKFIRFVLINLFTIPVLAMAIFAQEIEPEYDCKVDTIWEANVELDLAGYKIHYGKETGKYDATIDVNENKTGWSPWCGPEYDPFKPECCEYTLTFREPGTYYMAATAYDNEGNESEYSEERTHICPAIEPATAEIITPKPGSVLSDPGQQFCFESNIAGVTQWAYWIGSEIGKHDIARFGFDKDKRCSAPISSGWVENPAIPLDGRKIYLILWWKIGDKWFRNPTNYEYVTVDKTAPNVPVNFQIKEIK